MPVIYTGDGGYLDGIPARDLTDEEYDALTREQKRDVRRSGLYKIEAAEPDESEAKESSEDASDEQAAEGEVS